MQKVVQSVAYGAAYIRLLLAHRPDRQSRSLPLFEHGVPTAVLIVSGFLAPRRVMYVLESRFEDENISAYTFGLGLYSMLPFAVIKWRLAREISDLRRLNPGLKRLGIVAHSMGGLIIEELIVEELMAEGKLHGLEVVLVTLGTPFSGTWAALMGCLISFSAFEMLPVHPRYRDKNGPRKRVTVPFLSIAGEDDILAPAERCLHPDATWYPMPVDHAELIFKKKVFRVARDFIVHGTTSPEK